MTLKTKPRKQNLLVACFVVLAILVLLLRLFVFVHGHGRRTFRTAKPTGLSMASYHPAPAPAPSWTDSFHDGTPDFLRRTDPADRAAFRLAISPAQAGPFYQSNIQTTTDPATLEVQQ